MDCVIDTYNSIAEDFDRTRYSIWKCVRKFVDLVPKYKSILDVGCGNGKNMKYMIDSGHSKVYGIDATKNFVSICRHNNLNVIEGNIINMPFDNNSFDNIICIAVLHHLTSEELRIKAINEMIRVVKKGGKIMITTSSFENQFYKSPVKILDNEQNVLIPWKTNDNIFHRYYHLFKENELESLCTNNRISKIESFFECGNWIVILNIDN